ncbi:MAG: hypothetical protein U0Q19_10860 [Kineosporiaceae bacterium]
MGEGQHHAPGDQPREGGQRLHPIGGAQRQADPAQAADRDHHGRGDPRPLEIQQGTPPQRHQHHGQRHRSGEHRRAPVRRGDQTDGQQHRDQ